jgi:hypothetical protein
MQAVKRGRVGSLALEQAKSVPDEVQRERAGESISFITAYSRASGAPLIRDRQGFGRAAPRAGHTNLARHGSKRQQANECLAACKAY